MIMRLICLFIALLTFAGCKTTEHMIVGTWTNTSFYQKDTINFSPGKTFSLKIIKNTAGYGLPEKDTTYFTTGTWTLDGSLTLNLDKNIQQTFGHCSSFSIWRKIRGRSLVRPGNCTGPPSNRFVVFEKVRK